MTKYSFISSAIISAFFIALVSCNEGKKPGNEAKVAEVLPEDIVELRAISKPGQLKPVR
jgi:hypothetical protein